MTPIRNRRRLSLETHGAIELACGLALVIVPLALAFPAGAAAVSIALGVVLAGAAMGLTGRTASDDGASAMTAARHGSFDGAFGLIAAVAALGLALVGDGRAVILIAAAVVVETVLGLATRRSFSA
jgi:hypothetical protein